MKDAVEYYGRFSGEKSTIISDLDIKSNEFVLATIHRQENTDDLEKLKSILHIKPQKFISLFLYQKLVMFFQRNQSRKGEPQLTHYPHRLNARLSRSPMNSLACVLNSRCRDSDIFNINDLPPILGPLFL